MSSIVITINPLLILLVLCVVFINSLVAKKVNYKAYILEKESDISNSQQDVYRFIIGSVEYAKEIRLFNLKSFLIKKYADSQTILDELSLKSQKNSYKSGNCNVITGLIQQIILYSYLIYNVVSKGLAIGNMTIYMNAVEQLSGSLSSVFTHYLQLSRNSLDIQDYIEFINIPLTQQKTGNITPAEDKINSIEFRNVSFKYPGSEIYALKNVNLVISNNEKLCIVGTNGSGKSTFVKLLTRLYFPTEGEIFLNGVNINEYNYEEYQNMFSPVFQDICRYYFSIRENIVLSDEYNQERLDEICDNGLKSLINKLPQRI